jgi:hypothetical protein
VVETKFQELRRKSVMSKVGLIRELLKIVSTKVPMKEGSYSLLPRSSINTREPLALERKNVMK